MSAPRRRLGRGAVAAFAALAGACQPLPQPFADDRPPAELMKVPDSAAIAVASFDGEPRATAAKLSAAIVKELLKREIPASDRTTSVGSHRLEGRIERTAPKGGQTTLTVFWRLRDPAGRIVVERSDQLDAAAADWDAGNDDKVAQLAARGAEEIAWFVSEEAPKEQPQVAGRTRLLVRKIDGAPGDGNTALAAAVSSVLKREDLDIAATAGDKPDLALDATITVDRSQGDKQHVKIVWRVARAAGGEVGTVAQENDLPRGRLDAAWGDIAYNVAIAAEGGLLQLINRGMPPTRAAAATAPGEASPPPASSPVAPVAAEALPGNPAPAVSAPPAGAAAPAPFAPLPPLNTPAVLDMPAPIPFRGVPLPQ
jgi:hypothetical protein